MTNIPPQTNDSGQSADGPRRMPLTAIHAEELLNKSRSLQAGLLEVAGGASDLVARHENGWHRVRPTDAQAHWEPLPAEQSRVIEAHFHPLKTACVELRPGTHLVILPVGGVGGARCALVGEVRTTEPQVIQRLLSKLGDGLAAKAHLELTEAQVAGFMRQVTADFEELTWLRSLATYIEMCEVHNSIAGVASATLPSLCELISAEAIALLPRTSGPDANTNPIAFACGDLAVSADTYQRLVERYGPAAVQRPVVRNLGFGEGVCESDVNLRNLILARVGRVERQFGWLVAINKKCVRSPQTPGHYLDAQSYCESEFGTFEAGMVAAAAVLLGSHAHNVAMFQEQQQLFHGTVKALVNSIDAKDPYTCGHSDRVAQMARRLGQEVRYSDEECEQIYMTGLLHDIGKIGVRDDVLLKPGKLTDDELALIKKHPEIGCSIVEHVPQLQYALPGIRHHHESLDGTGYPHQLAGDQIAPAARLLAVVDAYDAMTSDRPYRKGMSPAKAEEVLRAGAGRQWDPAFVEAFLRVAPEMHALCGIRAAVAMALEPLPTAVSPQPVGDVVPSCNCEPGTVSSLEQLVPI